MDIFSTSFTYPRRSRHTHSPSSSLDYAPGAELRGPASEPFPTSHHFQQHATGTLPSEADSDAVAKLAMLARTVHGCHVSYFHDQAWSFHITGPYQHVMLVRSLILKECPVQVRSRAYRAILPLTCPTAPRRNKGYTLRDPRFAFFEAGSQARGEATPRRYRLPDPRPHSRRQQSSVALKQDSPRRHQRQRGLVRPRNRTHMRTRCHWARRLSRSCQSPPARYA